MPRLTPVWDAAYIVFYFQALARCAERCFSYIPHYFERCQPQSHDQFNLVPEVES